MRNRLKQNNIEAYNKKSLKSVYHILTSKYIVSTHTEFMLIKGKNQVYINLWHGMPLKKMKFLEDDKNIDLKELKFTNLTKDKIDYSIATSNIMKNSMASCFYINPRKILVSGQPRNDYLFDNKDKSLQQLQKLIDNERLDRYSKIIMYIPTFKSGIGRNDSNINNDEIINSIFYENKEFNRFLEKNNYLFIAKIHPFEENKFENLNTTNIKLIKNAEMNKYLITLNEILNAADMLVTDYSSVYFDYLNLDRPIIFTKSDETEYINNRGFILDNPDFWRPGPKVININEMMIEINRLFKDKMYYEEERMIINSLVNINRDNKASERIFNKIFK